MSGYDATRWAWSKQGLRPIQKLILLSLSRHADSEFSAFPSYETLREETGADRKTIWQALKLMAEMGLLKDTGKRIGATKSVVVWQLVVDLSSSENGTTKQFRKRSSSENGAVPFLDLSSSENGTTKQFRKRSSSENGAVPFLDLSSSENGTENIPGNNLSEDSLRSSSSRAAREKSPQIFDDVSQEDRTPAGNTNPGSHGRHDRAPENRKTKQPARQRRSDVNPTENSNLRSDGPQARAAGRARESKGRATRMTEDFHLPEDWRKWAITERPDMDVDRTFAIFRDYWINGKPMTNWTAAWRNWVRRDSEFSRKSNGSRRGDYDSYAGINVPAF